MRQEENVGRRSIGKGNQCDVQPPPWRILHQYSTVARFSDGRKASEHNEAAISSSSQEHHNCGGDGEFLIGDPVT